MKKFFIFATSLLLVVSCGQKRAKLTEEQTSVPEVETATGAATPTCPAHIDAKLILGTWSYLIDGYTMMEYSIYDDGMWLLYNANFCEGAIVEVGKWHLEETSIVLTKTYDFALSEAVHNTTRLKVDLTTNTMTGGGCTYCLTKNGWSKDELNNAEKAFKQYIK